MASGKKDAEKCPVCGSDDVTRLSETAYRPEWSCRYCGHLWKDLVSPERMKVPKSTVDKMREVLESNLSVYYVKDEEVNRQREKAKEKAIAYMLDNLVKGPRRGGTNAALPEYATMFGSSDNWTALQKAILIRDPECPICGKPTKEVHHIRPRHLRGTDHPSNLVGLCLECHDEIHRQIDDGIQRVLEEAYDRVKPPMKSMSLESFDKPRVICDDCCRKGRFGRCVFFDKPLITEPGVHCEEHRREDE